jgi:hypothetical protein
MSSTQLVDVYKPVLSQFKAPFNLHRIDGADGISVYVVRDARGMELLGIYHEAMPKTLGLLLVELLNTTAKQKR